jgi:phosphomannomutase
MLRTQPIAGDGYHLLKLGEATVAGDSLANQRSTVAVATMAVSRLRAVSVAVHPFMLERHQAAWLVSGSVIACKGEQMTINWQAIVKAYDVRGLVGIDLTEPVVEAIGAAFADVVELAGQPVVVGHDMRESSPGFAKAFSTGARKRGANIIFIGLCSTDENYFASGHLDAASAMFTASHNPASYNGIKLSRSRARGISIDTGLAAIRDRAAELLESGIPVVEQQGSLIEWESLTAYASHLRDLVNLEGIKPLKIVVDAGNGMGGHTVPAVLGVAAGLPPLPIEVVPLYFELDGTFPNHEANPLDPKNLRDLQAAVVAHGADLGLAFDGDADRCFVVDENGALVSPSIVCAIVAEREIARVKAAGETDISVIHNLLTSRIVEQTIRAGGAHPIRTKVGHSLIKSEMARTNAVFGGEHSAHYYFRDFWFADSGMLAALHVLQAVANSGSEMSALAERFNPYFGSGEINSKAADAQAAVARIEQRFESRAVFDRFDGLTVSSLPGSDDWWWFNVRTSNTEPLLRLSVEASTEGTLNAILEEALIVIRS